MNRHLLRVIVFIAIATGIGKPAGAQAHSGAGKLPPDLLQFFSGNWKGAGAFASGKAIQARVSFTPTLDSNWLRYEHHDEAPFTYQATSFWGFDTASKVPVAFMFDNSGGHRRFVSEGWDGERLLLRCREEHPQRGILFQRFVFEKQEADTFKMTFAVSRDALTWRTIDWLLFRKLP